MEGFDSHFTFEELTDSSKHPELVKQNRVDAMKYLIAGKRLSKLLGSIRATLGNRIIEVSSGFRNILLNKAVGSTAKNSSHQRFEAADIKHSVLSAKEVFELLMKNKSQLPDLRKAILEEVGGAEWVHIEVSMYPGEFLGFFKTTNGRTYIKVG